MLDQGDGGCTDEADCTPPLNLDLLIGLHTNACHMYACTQYYFPQQNGSRDVGTLPGVGVETPEISSPNFGSMDNGFNNVMDVRVTVQGGIVWGNTDSTYWPQRYGYSNPSVRCTASDLTCEGNTGIIDNGNGGAFGASGSIGLNGSSVVESVGVYGQQQINVPLLGNIMPFGSVKITIASDPRVPSGLAAIGIAYFIGRIQVPSGNWIPDPFPG